MKHYDDMEPRERDAWGAEHVMGWQRVEIALNAIATIDNRFTPDFMGSYNGTRTVVHPYSTDASADYEILKKVRETWDWKWLMAFENHLVTVQESYAKDKDDPGSWHDFSQLLYQPGDYLHSAWLAENGD